MNINDSEQQTQFRTKCSTWLHDNVQRKTQGSSDNPHGKRDLSEFLTAARNWQKKKFDADWAILHWPKIYGGLEASPLERIIWGQE